MKNKETKGWTKLHHAVNDQNVDQVQRLLQSNDGINVNDANNFKAVTPLMLSALNGNINTMQLLVDHGANIDQQANSRYDECFDIFLCVNDYL